MTISINRTINCDIDNVNPLRLYVLLAFYIIISVQVQHTS